MNEHFKHEEYPVTKVPNILYYVGKDGYIYSVASNRKGRKRLYKSEEVE